MEVRYVYAIVSSKHLTLTYYVLGNQNAKTCQYARACYQMQKEQFVVEEFIFDLSFLHILVIQCITEGTL